MKVVLFADRAGHALAPLADRTCVALLPVAGKALIEYAVESLVAAGLHEALVVVSPHAHAVEPTLGDGARWDMQLEYVLTRCDEPASSVIGRLAPQLAGDFLVMRGDVLRSAVLGAFLARLAFVQGDVVAATIGGVLAGLWLVRSSARRPLRLPSNPESPADWQHDGAGIEIDVGRLALIDSLRGYYRANLDAASGHFPGLMVPGRQVRPDVLVGRQSRLALSSVKAGPICVGSRCEVKPSAELLGDVVLSDDVVVDRGARLRAVVVLPHTYVGERLEVTDAIVSTNLIIDIDSGNVTRMTDACLRANLMSATPGTSIGNIVQRVLSVVLLILSLPLWPLMMAVAMRAQPGAPLRRGRLLGNRTEVDPDGCTVPRPFTTFEAATRVPVLRHLPKLLAVIAGDLRLVGVSPLTPEQGAARTDEWEYLRDAAPAGLIGPSQLTLPADAPDEQKRVAEAYYAHTRTAREDLLWLLRGAAALFTSRAWSAGAGAAVGSALGLRQRRRSAEVGVRDHLAVSRADR